MLDAALSPTTSFRRKQVYCEGSQTGWRPLCESWLHRLPGSVPPAQRARLHELFEWLVDPCIAFVRKHCQ